MNRLEAVRRLVLASPAACKRLDRLHPSDSALLAALDDPSALAGHLQAARLSRDEVESLIAPLVTDAGDGPPPTEAQIMDIRMVAKYG